MLALLFALLGGLGVAGQYAAYPYRTTMAISKLTRDSDGFLVGDFSRPWPFKIDKGALDQTAVVLPDGTELERFANRRALAMADSGSGFLVARPEIVFRLDSAKQAAPEETVSVILPTKTRDILYQVPFGIAIVLLLVSWRGLRSRTTLKALWWRPAAVATGSLGVALAGLLVLDMVRGPMVWVALLALLVSPLIAMATLLRAVAEASGARSRASELLTKLALLLGAVLGSCILAEAYLGWEDADLNARMSHPAAAVAEEDWFQLPENIVRLANSRAGALTMPDAWRRRAETVAGASSAYTWHGALHVHDESGFRRLNGPFPPKDPEVLRIMVVGDSLTYGYGIDDAWTFSSLLQRSLQKTHRVEILNLGRSGYQSQDILWVLQKFVPVLDPDLIIYAVALNDFLPSGQRVYSAYVFPLPEAWKESLLERTRLARLFDDAYQALLLALNLRWDFFDDILAGEKDYQMRFARDVAAMNRFVRERGLPAIIGIVFWQTRGDDPRAWDLVEIADRALEDAGFDLIPAKSSRERFKKQVFRVSRWEAHPNELAHSLIAEQLNQKLRHHEKLRAYRINRP